VVVGSVVSFTGRPNDQDLWVDVGNGKNFNVVRFGAGSSITFDGRDVPDAACLVGHLLGAAAVRATLHPNDQMYGTVDRAEFVTVPTP
jgi:hypothetical protein